MQSRHLGQKHWMHSLVRGWYLCYLIAVLWPTSAYTLADVDISPNPNPFTFCTSESEYIKKTGIRIHFFQNRRNPWIQLFGQNPYESIYGLESEYNSFFAIEYEYNYPWRDMDLSPKNSCMSCNQSTRFCSWWYLTFNGFGGTGRCQICKSRRGGWVDTSNWVYGYLWLLQILAVYIRLLHTSGIYIYPMKWIL